jgi:hypothetical protein
MILAFTTKGVQIKERTNLNLNIRKVLKTWRLNRLLEMFGELSFQGVLLQKCCSLSALRSSSQAESTQLYAVNCM